MIRDLKDSESIDNEENDSSLSDIVLNILDYYSFKQKIEDEGDAWKKDTKYENQDLIPEDLDRKVKELFLITLEKLILEEKKKIKNETVSKTKRRN